MTPLTDGAKIGIHGAAIKIFPPFDASILQTVTAGLSITGYFNDTGEKSACTCRNYENYLKYLNYEVIVVSKILEGHFSNRSRNQILQFTYNDAHNKP